MATEKKTVSIPKVSIIAADKVPPRVTSAGANEKLAEYRAALAAERAAAAAPLLEALAAGKALSGTAEDEKAAQLAAVTVVRLVKPGLKAAGQKASYRVSGNSWYVFAVVAAPEAAPQA